MIELFDYSSLGDRLATEVPAECESPPFAALAEALPAMLASGLDEQRYGDLSRWREALQQLPELDVEEVSLADTVGFSANASNKSQQLEQALRGLHPWRKGPFRFAEVSIDTEWRSDFKWDRLAAAIEPLAGKTVLDVGCGSGYHCWRMREAGAALTIGIDPTPLFICQYWALQKYLQDPTVWVLPSRLETMPPRLQAFDTTFSMGVLYHRRSPFDHLQELRDTLRPGGELLLETLVIEGGEGEALVPEGRYSKMGNVWFIPSPATLVGWLKKMKFRDVRLVDVSVTGVEEQRSTDWMQFQSLIDFLDPADTSKTVEGYPAPRRAILTARV